MKLFEMREKRSAAVVAMRALADLAETESRDLSSDENTKFGTLKSEIAALDTRIARQETVDAAERAAPAIAHGKIGDGAYEDRAREFSVVKCIRSTLPNHEGGNVDTGFEKEIGAECARRSGKSYEGFAVPDEYFHVEKRTLLVGSSAADLVPNIHRADLFIDVLRNKLVCARMGAMYLDGLVGSPIDIPKASGSSQAQWVSEDSSLSETDPSFTDVNLTPKTVGAVTSYSRRTLINSSPGIENIIRNDLSSVLANALDEKALIGTGASNTPVGVMSSGAVEIAAGTALSWEEVLSFIGQIDGDNALDGALGWVMNPHVRTKLRSTLVAASTDSRMIMTDPNSLAGYNAVATNALPGNAPGSTPTAAGSIIFGNWNDLIVARWAGGFEILSNPFDSVAYLKGRVLVRAMLDCDVQVRRSESFCFANDIVTDA